GHVVGFEIFNKGEGPILGGNLGGSLLSILGVFLIAGFSFQGTELIGITAGESALMLHINLQKMAGHVVGFEIFNKGEGPILGGNLGGSLLSILGVF
ncbi:hypothetical protein V8443_14755, partial [Staphylococcus aureus]